MKPLVTKTDIWAYINKSADVATQKKVEDWKASNDFDEALFNAIIKLYSVTENSSFENAINVTEEKAKFFKAVAPADANRLGFKKYLKYAAVLVLLISVAGIAYQNFSRNIITVETAYGEERQVKLSDGSVVWLNSSSKISYQEDSPRTIQLNGEAFFEVAKNKTQPFTVETPDNVLVKALGTSFNIKAYPENTYTETTLLTGKVEVLSKNYFNEKIIMLPNEHIRIIKAEGKPVKTKILSSQDVLAWREGKIRFKNTLFKNIASDLSNLLNIKLIFKNEAIANYRFTASFYKSTSVEEILEVLKASKSFKYNQNRETNEWIIK